MTLMIKELLAIYEAFRSWRHYLEGSSSLLMWSPTQESLVLCYTNFSPAASPLVRNIFIQFNLAVRLRPGKLGAKPERPH